MDSSEHDVDEADNGPLHCSYSKDDLLEAAEFLNSYYLPYLEPKTSLGTITASDLEKVCALRHRWDEHNSTISDDDSEPRLVEDDEEISTMSEDFRIRCIDGLWRRVDVWNATVLAQQFMITPSSVASSFQFSSLRKNSARSSSRQSQEDSSAPAISDSDDDNLLEDDELAAKRAAQLLSNSPRLGTREDSSSPSSRKRSSSYKSGPQKKRKGNSVMTLSDHISQHSHWYFSNLMNLPLSTYVRAVLPEHFAQKPTSTDSKDLPPFLVAYEKFVKESTEENGSSELGRNTPATLSLPPDHFTWTQYALITRLMIQLPRSMHSDLYNSPYLGGQIMGLGSKWSPKAIPRALFNVSDGKWLKADLVGLFIRAQRNLEAHRHLVQLFEYVGGARDKKAIFRGNHKQTNSRLKATPLLQHLLHWSITSQVVVTSPLVHRFIDAKTTAMYNLNPPSPPAEYAVAGGLALNRVKRLRRSAMEDEDPSQSCQLTNAVCSAILRNWARKYEPQLAPLFCSSLAQAKQLKAAGLFSWLLEGTDMTTDGDLGWPEKTVQSIHDQIKNKGNGSPDRTLARIDRRVPIGRYASIQVLEDVCSELLEDFLRLAKEPGLKSNVDIESFGLSQFEELRFSLRQFDKLRDESGPMVASHMLLELDPSKENMMRDTMIDIFSSVPTPWVGTCGICQNKLASESGEEILAIRKCSSCFATFHSSCLDDGEESAQPSSTLSVKSFLEIFAPLQQIFTAEPPENIAVPNYADETKNDSIKWTQKEIVVSRDFVEANKLETYRMSLFNPDKCGKGMHLLLSGEERVWDLSSDRRRSRPLFSIPQLTALFAGRVTEGPAQRAGVLVNDVIRSVEFVSFHDRQDEAKFQCGKRYELAELEPSERMELFRNSATKIKLFVDRPDQPIFEQAQKLHDYLEDKYQIERSVIKSIGDMWFCEQCCLSKIPDSQIETIWQARCCRAVVRYLATQWYGPRLWFERESLEGMPNKQDLSDFYEKSISLARLDLMLDAILYQHGFHDSHEASGHYAFTVGSKYVYKYGEKPLDLLVHGVDRLYKTIGDPLVKKAFLHDFCKLFCSWCLSSCQDIQNFPETRGPFLYALHVTRPFQANNLCQQCLVREVTPNDAKVCNTCQRLSHWREELTKTPSVLARAFKRSYSQRASLVGKVILLCPGHTLLARIAADLNAENVFFEDFGRPIEVLVASYTPLGLCEGEKDGESGDDIDISKGVFHLLPLVTKDQMQYLVSKTKLRKTQSRLTSELMKSWCEDGLLDLPGVQQMSYPDVRELVASTRFILQAATKEVSRQSLCICDGESTITGYGSEESLPPPNLCLQGESIDPFICDRANCLAGGCCDEGILSYFEDSDKRSHTLLDDYACSGNRVFNSIYDFKQVDTESINDGEDLACGRARSRIMHLPREEHEAEVAPFLVETPAEAKYEVLYSDLFFNSSTERDDFAKANTPLLSEPAHETVKRMLTLSKDCHAPRNPGAMGWGLELLQWNSPSGAITIGRLNPNGDGFDAGLRSGDRIVTMNALPMEKLLSGPLTLACSFNGVSVGANVPVVEGAVDVARLLGSVVSKSLAIVVEIQREQPHPRLWHSKTFQTIESSEASPGQSAENSNAPAQSHHLADNSNVPAQSQPATRPMLDTAEERENSGPPAISLPSPERGMEGKDEIDPLILFNQSNPSSEVVDLTADLASDEKLLPNENDLQITTGGHFYKDAPGDFKDALMKICEYLHLHAKEKRFGRDALVDELYKEASSLGRILITDQILMRDPSAQPEWRLASVEEASPALMSVFSKAQRLVKLKDERQRMQAQVNSQHMHPLPSQQEFQSPQPLLDKELSPTVDAIHSLSRYGMASELTFRDLDRPVPAPGPLVLTRAETSVLLTAIKNDQLSLGLRLLMPRYSIKHLKEQLKLMADTSFDAGAVQILPEGAWDMLKRFDYHRSNMESEHDPIIIFDTKINYGYRFPKVRCPINRLMEEFLDKKSKCLPVEELVELSGPTAELFRIRGGGSSKKLSDMDISEWDGTCVSGKFIPMVDNEVQKKKEKFLGRLRFSVSDNSAAPDKVCVHVRHMSRKGLVSDMVQITASRLTVIEEGSKDHQTLMNADMEYEKISGQKGTSFSDGSDPKCGSSIPAQALSETTNTVGETADTPNESNQTSGLFPSGQPQDGNMQTVAEREQTHMSDQQKTRPYYDALTLQPVDTCSQAGAEKSALTGSPSGQSQAPEATANERHDETIPSGPLPSSQSQDGTTVSGKRKTGPAHHSTTEETSGNKTDGSYSTVQIPVDGKASVGQDKTSVSTRASSGTTGASQDQDKPLRPSTSDQHSQSKEKRMIPDPPARGDRENSAREDTDRTRAEHRKISDGVAGESSQTQQTSQAENSLRLTANTLSGSSTSTNPQQEASVPPGGNVARSPSSETAASSRTCNKTVTAMAPRTNQQEKATDSLQDTVKVQPNQGQVCLEQSRIAQQQEEQAMNTERPKKFQTKHRKASDLKFETAPRMRTGVLGFLPDGRRVFWFHSDPIALFVESWSTVDMSESYLLHLCGIFNRRLSCLDETRQGRFALRPSRLPFVCVWGSECTGRNGKREVLGFATAKDLRDHLQMKFSFNAQNGREGDGALCKRISSSEVPAFMDSITKAACVLAPSLKSLTVEVGNGKARFTNERLFSEEARGVVHSAFRSLDTPFDGILSLIVDTWKLFTFKEENGFRKYWYVKQMKGHSQLKENLLGHKSVECFGDPPLQICQGQVGALADFARKRLLELLDNIPNDLLPSAPQRGRLEWKSYLQDATTVETMMQTFSAMVGSVDTKNFPKWYSGETLGWSIHRPLCYGMTWSALFLQVSVFDLALSETIAICASESVFNVLPTLDQTEMSYDEKVVIALTRARRHGIGVYQGEYKSQCSVCKDGGELLCCELCSNVGHKECCNLRQQPERFVCSACMDDFKSVEE
mmetsp:Transcript_22894/g.63693  ORF Transcript_22894/g.63693 Transcript_22894/m.63693 type:complete len:2946 (+) Transcript_22894:142-8979(+)|eukprot:CAMPEP_0168760780 /NCGR_PEP_ID=MMETSP0724-20121128/22951_1 /TAXON_ID=265536 /ORGANISM="Amphiprora sp., Strain CCMP467" /LENGTH=2945 /DNA_ID=CAMNT_0008809817 /DNA_START=91 /DNA_END=8928 /DNA_ORIENTATION=+